MSDVKLLEPQRLTDNPNGGGLSTGVEIVDGQVNNLFDDISRVDRVNGDVSLRKGFVQATTANTDLYSGLHVIVAAPPEDDNVSVVVFRTPGWADERDDAKNVVERYLDASVVTRMIPYDRQLAGQRTVLVFQRLEAAVPDIGEVFAIEDGLTGFQQVIRIAGVSQIEDIFTDTIGDFAVRVLTLEITQPLEQDFLGSDPSRYFRPDAGRAVIRRTIVSDAARYKGVTALADDAGLGDVSIKVASVFTPLVPSATTEIPLTDTPPPGSVALVKATHRSNSDGALKRSIGALAPFAGGGRLFFGCPIAPGSASITFEGVATYADSGDGTFIGVPSSEQLVIDYDTGAVSYPNATFSGFVTLSAHPAAAVSQANFSYNIAIEEATRGYVYVATLKPIPAAGSTSVSFRALGRWYELRDTGDGVLRGEPGVGSGIINFATGTVSATLGALPDIGSSVIVAYGTKDNYRPITEDIEGLKGEIRFTVPEGNIVPGTFEFNLVATGGRDVIDDGEGNLTTFGPANGAEGTINYGTGEVRLKIATMPTAGVNSKAAYETGASEEETFNPSKSGSTITLELATIPIEPKSLSLVYQQEIALDFPGPIGVVHELRDNGAGALIDSTGSVLPGSSVNYTTGVITFNPDFAITAPAYNYAEVTQPLPGRQPDEISGIPPIGLTSWRYALENYEDENFAITFVNGTAVIARYKPTASVDTPGEYLFQVESVGFDLAPNTASPVVPGSVSYSYTRSLTGTGGSAQTVFDRGGVLYTGLDPKSNAASPVGTINYQSGRVELSTWPASISPTASILLGGLVQIGQIPIPSLTGRAPGSPLRPGSFGLSAVRASDSATVSATADASGYLNTSAIHGYVDVQTGVFGVAFGQYVLDSALSPEEKAEPWYDPALVDVDGYVWRADPVIPGTIRFNAVVQSATPLDPQIVGINPVRLPLDGRVQMIRAGDTLVIHETLSETLPSPLTAGQVVFLPRSGLASVALYDQLGLGVPADKFSVNLASGEITMATPLSLAGYEEPLVALHSVEDMALCTDAEITGQLKLAQALSRGYNAATTYVSSALVLGDVQARYEGLFEQNTWTTVWSDGLIGDPPSSGAQYNELTYPLQVLNRDAITQRWALVFTSSTGGNIVAEELGILGTFTTSVDLAPTNPATGQPYFQMAAAGFGLGWATGNVIRFNTIAAGGPIWAARTVRTGAASGTDDRARLQLRWDKETV